MDIETADTLPGDPDGFERLWTPHRMVYMQGGDKPADEQPGPRCPFCRVLPDGQDSADDERLLVVARAGTCYAILNLYPYNPGHLLVCPYRHVAAYPDLTAQETVDLAELTQAAMRVLAASSRPRGFNLGMNQGAVAGAGIAGHLHQHVVPRWPGDANFLPVVARTKAMPQLLGDTRERLAQVWAAQP